MPTIYRIDGGTTFEGTLEQAADALFKNMSEEALIQFCVKEGCKLEKIQTTILVSPEHTHDSPTDPTPSTVG